MNKLIAILILYCFISPVWAIEAMLESIKVDSSASAVERGADNLMNACHGCHSLKYIRYRDLLKYGMDKKKVDEWRGDQPLDAAITSQMPDDAAKLSFGKSPPDLSLINKARDGGANYVYSYLTGYYTIKEGMSGNHIFPETKMPDVLGMSGATEPAQRKEIQGKASDIVSFLNWAADPHEEERHKLGYYVIGYLVFLSLLLYFVKNQIWSKLK